jgi:2-desacetyl-2-hydroxyethyl bacteriochlorophyllide A dehydrogenase
VNAKPAPEARLHGVLEARALWFDAPQAVALRLESVPPPSPGEARIQTIASALSQGTEMLVYRGEVPDDLPLDLPTLAGGFGFPIKYGYATVGRVLDAGSDVDRLVAGDHVFVHHPHQDAFVVPADMPVPLPDGLDPLLGLFVANLETAVNIVHDAPLYLGETAVVFGQGVVGLLVSQLLKLAGAGRVIAVDPLAKRRELARALAVEETFEPDDDLTERVLEATGGRGADVAVEVSGSGAALQSAIDTVAIEGTVVVASWYGKKPVTLSLGRHFHRGRVRIISSQVGQIPSALGRRWDRARRTETVLGLLPRLRLEELVSHRFPFERAPEAYRLVDERPGEVVQAILVYDELL